MAVKRNCPMLDASEALNEFADGFIERQKRKKEKLLTESDNIREKLEIARDNKYIIKKAYGEFCTKLKDELLGDAIKSIYISALRENMALTENGIFLANNVVENFIKESGGADHLMQKMRGKTYALDFIVSVVEGTYASILEDVDSENPESFESSDEKKEEMFDDMSKDGDITNAVNIIAKRVTDAEEEFIKKNNEDKEALKDIADKFSERIRKVEDDGEETSEAPETEEETPDNPDMEEETPDSEEDESEDMDSESEDSDTEEETDEDESDGEEKDTTPTEDKSNDKGEEDKSEEETEKEEEIKQESVLMVKAINDRRTKRQRNVLEQVIINFTESVLKDEYLKEEYIENGKMDMGSIVESSKCIYGFLETVNTLQIHRVDSNYIQEALENM